jgi:hypothetical protein
MKVRLSSKLRNTGILTLVALSLISNKTSGKSTISKKSVKEGFNAGAVALFDTSSLHYYSFESKALVDYKKYASSDAALKLEACMGSEISFTAPEKNTITNYSWTGPNGFTSTEKEIRFYSVLPKHEGVYSYVAESNGEITQGRFEVIVLEAPIADIMVSGSNQEHVMLLSAIGNDTQAKYTWLNKAGDVVSRSKDFYVSKEEAERSEFRLVVNKNGCQLRIPVSANPEIGTLVSAKRQKEVQVTR